MDLLTKTAAIRLRIARALEAVQVSGLARSGSAGGVPESLRRRRLAILVAKALDLYWPGATRPY